MGVFGQRYASSGSALGTEFQVNTYTTGSQSEAAVASDAAGGFVVVWSSYGQDGSSSGIFGERYAAPATATPTTHTLTPALTPTVTPTDKPTNTVTPTGTRTSTPPLPCVGDCDGNSLVTINELVLGVKIVLGSQLGNACPAFANSPGCRPLSRTPSVS